jgi:hypothetical protein
MAEEFRIEVHLRDSATPDAELCTLYWERPPRATARTGFTHRVTTLAARFRLSRSEITARVRAASYAIMPERSCPSCGRPQLLYNRGDFESHATSRNNRCMSCTLPVALANFQEWEETYAASLRKPDSEKDADFRRHMESMLTHTREKIAELQEEIALLPESHAVRG